MGSRPGKLPDSESWTFPLHLQVKSPSRVSYLLNKSLTQCPPFQSHHDHLPWGPWILGITSYSVSKHRSQNTLDFYYQKTSLTCISWFPDLYFMLSSYLHYLTLFFHKFFLKMTTIIRGKLCFQSDKSRLICRRVSKSSNQEWVWHY